jgi:hypothetical protein
MNPDDLTDEQLDQLAADLAPRFPTGSHGDRVVLTKRQFIGATTGVLSAGALMALGVDEASAQAAGSVGTASSPVNVSAYDLNVANAVTSSLPMGGNDIENAGAVSTGGLDIDDNPARLGYRVDELSGFGTGGSLDISNYSMDQLRVVIELAYSSSTAPAELSFNGDASGNGNYTFWPHNAQRVDGADSIELFAPYENFSDSFVVLDINYSGAFTSCHVSASGRRIGSITSAGVRTTAGQPTSIDLSHGDADFTYRAYAITDSI